MGAGIPPREHLDKVAESLIAEQIMKPMSTPDEGPERDCPNGGISGGDCKSRICSTVAGRESVGGSD
ncbi:hypothetical protein PHMEG_00010820 [Phytophthora megakarya]|uniref:Uncharacterized protein n=1 Tax=Phytophthora megakarya TaxID=4795 RepID=A0A225WE59_9STRA|nr:hypothetical protein PHMEG_00010820 [Phytophthora megakarya]